MGDVLFVWTAVSNMFGARMRSTFSYRLVSIDTVSCLRTSLVQCLINGEEEEEEEALVDVLENGEIVTEETLSRKRKQRKGKEMERRRNGSFDRSIGTKCIPVRNVFSKEYHLRD